MVHISQESFRGKQFESCGAYLKSHLEESSLKVVVHISQESFRRKQFKSCGVYISRVVKGEAV